MKQHKFIVTACLLFFIVTDSCSQINNAGHSSIRGVFVASTPCSKGTRPLPGIAASDDCELMKWHLTLYQDEQKRTPTTFTLQCSYGLPKQGTNGLIGGGKTLDIEGKWTIIENTQSNPHGSIYWLTDNKTNKTISFVQLNNNLLHLLDSHQRLMIGNAACSYTMNRIDNK